MESQAQIRKLAEEAGKDNVIVVPGASDIESAEIAAKTRVQSETGEQIAESLKAEGVAGVILTST